ncbi:MAG: acyltransferase [Candidatus Diapherotrites archaeon]|nr:acyltransferase [Candidatus Diapherotrites archaeon]
MKGFGRASYFKGRVEISHPECVSIGENSCLDSGTKLRGTGSITIGNNVRAGENLFVISDNHDYEGEELPYGKTRIKKPVRIGDNVWIGSNVTILGGAAVGEGAVIGAGSVVVKDVPACAVVAGNPAQVKKFRDKKKYERLKAEKKFNSEKNPWR